MTNNPGAGTELDLINDSGQDIPVTESIALACINAVSQGEGVSFSMVELVYVDENEILDVNKNHLKRDYVTDIISFHYHDEGAKDHLEGSLVMCASRIEEQANELSVPVLHEYTRVLIHGLLHVCGLDDGTPADKAVMTQKEDLYLSSIG